LGLAVVEGTLHFKDLAVYDFVFEVHSHAVLAEIVIAWLYFTEVWTESTAD
jgi:hypothetical protein